MNNEKKIDDFWSLITKLVYSSESKYKNGDYKGAIDDKKKAKALIYSNSNSLELEVQFIALIKRLRNTHSKYDLIQDYKKKIDDVKKLKIISMLEKRSQNKYNSGDYKGSIRALRRSEKYL